ncbi:MAG TPA: tRNA pseudouridine(38-40) synthase TruA [Longilinea sp.]|nr:tRNA pseudouridine(38-40) synthase TruA [Longilinea sp.]
MARYQIILVYDGTDFQGFQRQGSKRTVQLELESSLRRLGWKGRAILSAGRTDAGVHASGQVVAFDLNWNHPLEELQNALNAFLPGDVAVKQVRQVAADFHPRYDATSRTYRYRLTCQAERDPLSERFAWRVWPPVNRQLLQQAAAMLVGVHDFAAFGRAMKPAETTVREVYSASWRRDGSDFDFEVSANAFLYHMVRRMVYLQVRVGHGRLSLDELEEGITLARKLSPGLAPPNGLQLVSVAYGQE